MLRDRINDAVFLAAHGRTSGSLLSILVAVAATARKRYPRPTFSDREAFEGFIVDEMSKITGGAQHGVKFYYNGVYGVLIETILYKIIRCQLVHEGYIPEELGFSMPVEEGSKAFNVLGLYDPIEIPIGWIWNLATAVMEAPENADEFLSGHVQLPAYYRKDASIKAEVPHEDPARLGAKGIGKPLAVPRKIPRPKSPLI
jgi:hypothetical protein